MSNEKNEIISKKKDENILVVVVINNYEHYEMKRILDNNIIIL